MKTIVAVIFIGIFTYAFGNSAKIKECHKVTPMDGFNPTKFFEGKWHMTHVTNGIFSFVCQDLETTRDGEQLFIEYDYNKNGKERNVRCESEAPKKKEKGKKAGQETINGKDKKNGQISFNCKVNTPGFFSIFSKTNTFQADFTIMTTDYNDYALFYKCVTLASGEKSDNYVVLRRGKSDENIPGIVQSLLRINHESLKKCSELINVEDIKSEVV
uniref:Triatin n=1 Tax=Triatoma infestans TaxID=30076 RepID=Q45KX3_TRIIF|nr:triatin [Triatoma infestans]